MGDFEKYVEYCNDILKIDTDIRYVGIISESISISRHRKGLQKLLTDDETKESISNIVTMWDFRNKLISKLGNGIYSLTVYSKSIRVSIPFHKDGLILVSMDPDASYHEIIALILKFKENIS